MDGRPIVTILLLGAIMLLGAGCFKEEELNAEADIELCWLHTDSVDAVFYSAADTLVEVLSSDTQIRFSVKEGTDLSGLAPMFQLTSGAVISPESGSEHDFTNGAVTYVVTSEDGNWSRTYSVSVGIKQRTVDELAGLDFEYFYLEPLKGQYYVWNDSTSDGYTLDCWATGNPGYAISMSSAAWSAYPSVPYEEGYEGAGVKLQTLSTGPLGKLVGKPIAAGNLFMGKFDTEKALTQTLQATIFGVPVAKKPLIFSGYYKYSRGETFTDVSNQTLADRTDEANIYAVLFLNTDSAGNTFYLHGDDVKSSNQIVALADFVESSDVTEWTYFEVAFDYYDEIDSELLENYGYSISVVCTSSIDGATFEGAIGSTLIIDKLSITWQ